MNMQNRPREKRLHEPSLKYSKGETHKIKHKHFLLQLTEFFALLFLSYRDSLMSEYWII